MTIRIGRRKRPEQVRPTVPLVYIVTDGRGRVISSR